MLVLLLLFSYSMALSLSCSSFAASSWFYLTSAICWMSGMPSPSISIIRSDSTFSRRYFRLTNNDSISIILVSFRMILFSFSAIFSLSSAWPYTSSSFARTAAIASSKSFTFLFTWGFSRSCKLTAELPAKLRLGLLELLFFLPDLTRLWPTSELFGRLPPDLAVNIRFLIEFL